MAAMTDADEERPSTRLRTTRARPVVVAIGGLDPSGGAGILADARAIAAAGAHPACVATALTVQSTAGCVDVAPVDGELLRAQLAHLVVAQPPAVVKLGALGSGAVANVIAQFLATCTCPIVVDPVAAASVAAPGGRPLADESARAILAERILPHGAILCANGPELEALAGAPVPGPEAAIDAARVLLDRGARAVLAKGGHWRSGDATDVLVRASGVTLLPAPRLDAADVHGTGCTLASLFAGRLAVLGDDDDDAHLLVAARWAKGVLFRALEAPVVVGEGQRVVRVEQG
jgi:hydroxymethylpyrimidine/phosphomethylpyrimidine kinase